MTLQNVCIGVNDLTMDKEKYFPSLKKAVNFIYESGHKEETLLFFSSWNAFPPEHDEKKENYYNRMKKVFHEKFDR